MKIQTKEVPHEKTMCIGLIQKYVERLAVEESEYAKLYWQTNILVELQHLI